MATPKAAPKADEGEYYLRVRMSSGKVGGRTYKDTGDMEQFFTDHQSHILGEQLLFGGLLRSMADAGVDMGNLALAALAEAEQQK